MRRFLGSMGIPVGLCVVAIAIVVYGYTARATLYTTGNTPRPLSGFSERYYAAWTPPRAVETDVFTEHGDIRFADDRVTTLINTPYEELDPIESPDGSILVFASRRTDGEGGADLWWSRREGNGYSPPERLPGTINTVFNERSPSLAPIGDGQYLLAFASNRSFGGVVDHDLFVSRGRFGESWSAPKLLKNLSTGADERAVAMFPSGDAVLFSRPGLTGIEYWESWALPGGRWSEPQPLASLHHPENEHRLVLDAGGMQLIFSRGGQLLRSDLRLLRPLPKPPYSLTPAWLLLALAVLLLLLRLLSMKWRGLEIIYWCLLVSLLLHLLLWWLLRDEGLKAPTLDIEGESEGLPPIEFTLDMFDRSDGEPAVQAALGDTVQALAQAEAEAAASSEFARREFAPAEATAPAPAEASLRDVARDAPDASATRQQSSVAKNATPETEARFEDSPGIALAQATEASTARDPGSDARADAVSATRETSFAEARPRRAEAPDRPTEFDASSDSVAAAALAVVPKATRAERSPDAHVPRTESRITERAPGIRLAQGRRAEAARSEQTGSTTRKEPMGRRVVEFDGSARESSQGRPSAPDSTEVRLARAASGQPSATAAVDRVAASSTLLPTKRSNDVGTRPHSPALAEASGSAASNERRSESASRPQHGHATVDSETGNLIARSTDGDARPADVAAPSTLARSRVASVSASPRSGVNETRRAARPVVLPTPRRARVGSAASLASAPQADESVRRELAASGTAGVAENDASRSRFVRRKARVVSDRGSPSSQVLGIVTSGIATSIAAAARPTSAVAATRRVPSLTPAARPRVASTDRTGAALTSSVVASRTSTNRNEAVVVAKVKSGVAAGSTAFRRSESSRPRPSSSGRAPRRELAMRPRLAAVPPPKIGSRRYDSFLPRTANVEPRRVAVREVEGSHFGSIPEVEAERRESPVALAAATATRNPGHPSFPSRSRRVIALSSPTDAPSQLPRVSAESRVAVITKPRDRTDGIVAWLSARVGPKKQEALEKFGGDKMTEAAVARGLEYLASIQRRDGSWGARALDDKYGQTRVGVTAIGLLAFLGAGHYPGSGSEYEDAVAAAIEYLLDRQMRTSGHFGRNTAAYSHGIATYALGEAYLLTRDDRLLEPLRRAVRQIVVHQEVDADEEDFFGGWSYYYHDGHRYDRYPRVSVTVWQVMALKTAELAGIDIQEARFKASRFYLVNSWSNRIGRILYSRDPSRLRSQYPTLPGSTPAAVFALLLLNQARDSDVIRSGVNMILNHLPREWEEASTRDFLRLAKGNAYFMYYSTLALFIHGGDAWFTWNKALKETLLPSQADDGSWRPISIYAEYAGDTQEYRAYTTALNVLMLEVYYRYLTPFLEKSAQGR